MTRHGRYPLRCLYGALLALACVGYPIDPAFTLIVVLAAGGAAFMVVTESIYTPAAPKGEPRHQALLLALSIAALGGAVVAYFIGHRLEWPSGLLAMAIYGFRALALARHRAADSTA